MWWNSSVTLIYRGTGTGSSNLSIVSTFELMTILNNMNFKMILLVIKKNKGTLKYARWHSFRVTDQSFGPRPTKIGM